MENTKEVTFLEYCPECKCKHVMTLQPCPDCSGRSCEDVPQPKSEKVKEKCMHVYMCTGCEAYQDHLAI